ncbi:hypothetical protein [Pararhizobium mangrovi]|uniref:Uncharacterized protein n=1 Tax=Pararhizobium mangrovi TaxID=2590452 RepID=A0A506U4J3_9HYPH|nr:hypothetical protein [Pararhizobium mangrovi]TPW27964.1 hypothetical protein FJU11_10500 [Pararhizobium mangrovi]
MTRKTLALGLAFAMFTATGAMACDWHNTTAKMSTPVKKEMAAVLAPASAPVDLWLVPYLG